MKTLSVPIFVAVLTVLSATAVGAQKSTLISKTKAIEVATADNRGSLGTWVDAFLHEGYWYILATSKSVKAPRVYILRAADGAIVDKKENSSDSIWVGTAEHRTTRPVLRHSAGLQLPVIGLTQWPADVLGRFIKLTGILRKATPADKLSATGPVLELGSFELSEQAKRSLITPSKLEKPLRVSLARDQTLRLFGKSYAAQQVCNEDTISNPDILEVFDLKTKEQAVVILCPAVLDGMENQVALITPSAPPVIRVVSPSQSTYKLSDAQLQRVVEQMLKKP